MISMIIKSVIAFTISFVVLSFQVNRKPIFYHLSEIMGPLGTDIQRSIGKSVKRGIKKSGEISKDFIQNSDLEYKDYIDTKKSGGRLGATSEVILEDIRKDEKRKLDELINND